MRDMTQNQFDTALARHGITRHYLGYYDIGAGRLCCAANAGPRRRDQLAYLLRKRDKHLTPAPPEPADSDEAAPRS